MPDLGSIAASQQLVIRRPAAEVFRAFADPEVTTNFWFNRASGPLAVGARVTWHFDAHGLSADVRVLEFEPDERIVFEWGADGKFTTVEFMFQPRQEDRTRMQVVNTGFKGDAEAIIAQALDSTGGFSLVLAAAKAWLEYGVELRVVEDKF